MDEEVKRMPIQTFPIEEAPRDGSRILVKRKIFHYSHQHGYEEVTHPKWEECRWYDGKWEAWTGEEHTHTTDRFNDSAFITWMPLP